MRGIPGNRKKKVAAGVLLVSSAGMLGFVATNATAAGVATTAAAERATGETRAKLRPLNNSPVSGTSTATVNGRMVDVTVDAKRLLKKMPHAQHIHFGAQARHECPTVNDDDNADHRINTAEGQPAYGRVRVSLTKRGDTSPKSTLAVNRFPTAPKRQINYDRDGIRVGSKVARAIRNGKAVVVIHGIDYNNNGKYDFAAGRSELDPSLPAEATDPVTCGRLKVVAPAQAEEQPSEPPLPVPGRR